MNKETLIEFVKKHRETIALIALLCICYFLFFCSMGNYPLFDADEARYGTISRNMFLSKEYLTMLLNGEFFFDKPPLFFWTEALFCMLFGKATEITLRIPVALSATFGVFMTYFLGKRIASKRYGMICALILATGCEYIILGRTAIIDMLYAVVIATTTFCGLYTLFCSENYKKYFWWLSYIFAGFAVLTKGPVSVLIPTLTILISYAVAKREKALKEIFTPLYFIPGLVFFLVLSLPWHIIMYQQYGDFFLRTYFKARHAEYFLSTIQDRSRQPFYYFIPVFFAAFLPWIFSSAAQVVMYFKKSVKNTRSYIEKFNDLQPISQFMVVNFIFFAVAFVCLSCMCIKRPAYILPVMFPAAMMLGKFWFDYTFKDENERAVNISTLVMNFGLIISAAALLVAPMYIKSLQVPEFFAIQIFGLVVIFAFIILNGFAIFKDKKLVHFLSIPLFMIVLSIFFAKAAAPFITNLEQRELMKFAKIAKEHNKNISVWGMPAKYSLVFYGGKDINYTGTIAPYSYNIPSGDYVIIRNIKDNSFDKDYNYEIIEKGKDYILVKNVVCKNIKPDKKTLKNLKRLQFAKKRRHPRV